MFEDAVKQQILSTVGRLRMANSGLTMDFYARLFRLAPETRRMFPKGPDGMLRQSEKLFDMILVLVQSLDHLQMLVAEIEVMGARHAEYGVTEAQYDQVKAALIETLAEHVADWNVADADAWGQLLDYVSDLMVSGARDRAATLARSA
ncbi:ABC transporter substrate-binding protein [Salipiger aestuarii]|uniref:Hemoglobin-like flavoprotein n=1 Tax=Salipiger aestuarii TaxID=568098 RepID=A0A327YVA7_9RHOB|nr:globin domain-containing protein [Salipiger aestuarii]EIE48816.1 methyl-accepting chemotaxis sensory transducer [Citreicella sp. 357]KAB2543466.1 ABC transporter substrate-binding protein [Salipiger aestuarii]RAK21969.1 hemoglobin-like flavoprotein [Salipiger aestuarii]